ncbi:MAG TPA: hypothetical protein VMT82_01695 [candidate division Zixibacteria bacterium]|nr:hypothetical protein [candidate division Zixibacteria bacterium]
MGSLTRNTGTVTGRQKLAAALIVLAFLTYTTARTSKIYCGTDHGLNIVAKLHLKQRQFCLTVFCLPAPDAAAQYAPVPHRETHLRPYVIEFEHEFFFPRCSDLPPPFQA